MEFDLVRISLFLYESIASVREEPTDMTSWHEAFSFVSNGVSVSGFWLRGVSPFFLPSHFGFHPIPSLVLFILTLYGRHAPSRFFLSFVPAYLEDFSEKLHSDVLPFRMLAFSSGHALNCGWSHPCAICSLWQPGPRGRWLLAGPCAS
ncbi:MAG TPA: hypothetical protein VFX19_00845 [Dehalococcoidia bacterium]|nr:hypothetical protein [Dehalococcoidia bacterium]